MEPNPIDFNTVFVEFGELENSGNVMVLITVCSCFILYIIGLILARHADRRDRMKVSSIGHLTAWSEQPIAKKSCMVKKTVLFYAEIMRQITDVALNF